MTSKMAWLQKVLVVSAVLIVRIYGETRTCKVTSSPLNFGQWKGELHIRHEPKNSEGYYINDIFIFATRKGIAKLLDKENNLLGVIYFNNGGHDKAKEYPSAKYYYTIEFSMSGRKKGAELWFETAGCESKDLLPV
ncbi:uncharacterized protein LOC135498968 [Lineus longissimus]|uniref:uncharacterized protein LOC135498968 n=1 Tax=Lineus longissimus TaxID=88925 RepID=UPI002B4F2258